MDHDPPWKSEEVDKYVQSVRGVVDAFASYWKVLPHSSIEGRANIALDEIGMQTSTKKFRKSKKTHKYLQRMGH